MHLNDEELSRILSEHTARRLIPYGRNWEFYSFDSKYSPPGCLLQIAKNSPNPIEWDENPLAKNFDKEYIKDCSPEELLENIEAWNKSS